MNANQATEAELALLRYPFDQYQRYQDIRVAIDLIQSRQPETPLLILDVGGNYTTLEFLANYTVVTANMDPEDGLKLQCDGTRLPFKNDSFDVIVTVDTLEHLPPDRREAFIAELLRVTATYAIITGPFASGYNEMAEAAFNDFLVEVLGRKDRFLQEHLQNGLPKLDLCLDWMAKRAEHAVTIPSGYIHHWLPLMAIRYYLSHFKNGLTITMDLDRVYNYKCYWSDHKAPSYRQVIVASKKGNAELLAEIKAAYPPPEENPPPDLNGVVTMWQALRWLPVLEAQDHQIKALEYQLDVKDEQIKKLWQEIENLRDLIERIKAGKVMRLLAIFEQVKGLIRS